MKKILLLSLTVVVFGVMVKLGFWQLDRGQQKQRIEQQLQQWQQGDAVSLATALSSEAVELTGRKVAVRVAPITSQQLPIKTVYWDNQTWQGKVGYLVFQPVKIIDSDLNASQIVLLELGFVAAGRDRQTLPQVASVTQAQSIEGRLYRRQDNPLSEGLMVENMPQTSAIRIQNLALESLAQDWKMPLLGYVIQPMTNLELRDGKQVSEQLPHPWTPVPLSSKRHFGYAVQWFSMATVLLLLVVMFVYRAFQPQKFNGLERHTDLEKHHDLKKDNDKEGNLE
ncbi:SURF1 family protein [Vibrio gangliei]|uniref:SURF1 family protein n=1 Tax=Vibrio gangliei TaxID=2077090 RepID=UPI001300AFCB|nr:SURF1 family protein [Vibrio gangliei]